MLDTKLFLEIQGGNRESFKRLFYLYYDSLVIYAEGYLYDRASSEDVVQEVFICFWEHADTINITTSIKGYMYKMVRNKCLNHLKKLDISDKLEILEYTHIRVPDNHPNKLQDERIKKFNKVSHLIESMPNRMREIFNLKYKQNYSYSEISRELNISTNTIKTQLKRAKDLLHSHFL
ncbi:RNA polymerase sigma factor [Autumnicola musiva]|uniref:RNA polymerase sigma-70 factor n=1 Tax=Autumnicola musiva TaxID=3075589 RepID=A0ABU3D9W4_9FLAO|nr:RNA polymerase sigma-70 factor [Zunongwangia sp. F117]MDT0678330.1 RNA polymerase sigma-70 factor [Zunongwangia sp. F117]